MKHKRSNKTEQINIRVSPKEKILLQKNASDMNMDMSDYIRKCTILSNSKNICGSLPQIVCQVQDILNYILEAYDNDPVLEQEVDKLWEKL